MQRRLQAVVRPRAPCGASNATGALNRHAALAGKPAPQRLKQQWSGRVWFYINKKLDYAVVLRGGLAVLR
ncbi:hypothetical protein ACUNE3_24575 [Serratia sp. IR-2025]